MKIYESAVKKPVTTILIFIGIMVFGTYSYINLPVDLYPEIELNAAMVMTTYEGASAEDIEQNITKRLEMVLSSVSDLKEITSTSRDNISLVTLQFEYGTNMDEAANDMRSMLEMVRNMLPEDAASPQVFKFSSDMMPIMFLSARTTENFEGLYKILDDKVAAPINRVDGVASTSISGAPERQIQVLVDPKKMEAYGMTVEALAQIIAVENRNVPSGMIDVGTETFSLRVNGEFKESDEISELIIGSRNGKNVYVKDVAIVKDTLKERSTEVYTNGERGASIVVQKQSGSNVVTIAKKINKALPEIQKSLPPSITLEVVMDSSEFINNSINSLVETVLLAFLIVMVVVFFFLGRWRATIIIILTIPISLITAFIYLMITGNTLNIVSLSSLTIAIGMVVDDAIVVLENITTHIEKGSRPKDAAIYATNEVAVAVIASTLTIVAVFMPLTMVSGLAGIMFKQLGWIVTIVMCVSTVTALTLTPMLCSLMLRKNPKRGKWFNRLYGPVERGLDKLDRGYGLFLRWCLRHRGAVVLGAIVMFVASLGFLKVVDTDFFPSSDNSQTSVSIELPIGTHVESARSLTNHLYDLWTEKYPEMKMLQTTMGVSDGNNIFMSMRNSGTHIISMTVRYVEPKDRKRDIYEMADEMRKDLAAIPDIHRFTVNPGGGNMMGAGSSALEVEILGHDLTEADRLANEAAEIMRNTPGLRDVKISREDYQPQLQVVFDRKKLAMNGLNITTAAMAVRNRINGALMSYFREDGEEYEILVRHNVENRQNVRDIENITLYNNIGRPVRLGEVGTVVESFSPPSITRTNRERSITVSGSLYEASLGSVSSHVSAEMAKLSFPQDFAWRFTGNVEDQQESFADILVLLLLVIILVYIVMAAQFESFRDPFIIMLSLPFAFSGVFLALWAWGVSLSLIALIGAVMLVGIVVKNGIVMIDYINLNRERGISLRRAVISGGESRLRPVLMTTLSTVLGMLPMAIGMGEGSEIWQPMGVAIVGGLTVSTLLTLVVIPTVYCIFGKKDIKKERRRIRKVIKSGKTLTEDLVTY